MPPLSLHCRICISRYSRCPRELLAFLHMAPSHASVLDDEFDAGRLQS